MSQFNFKFHTKFARYNISLIISGGSEHSEPEENEEDEVKIFVTMEYTDVKNLSERLKAFVDTQVHQTCY
jgi:hypothetical protein